MLRITGGQLRGRQIECPKGKAIRPTTSFVRESLFSILGPRILEARVLDLFCGTGIIGIEAISRGAAFVQAIEEKPTHCNLLKRTREKLNIPSKNYQIACQDVLVWAKHLTPGSVAAPFDLIFLDPPYVMEEGIIEVLSACIETGTLSPDGLIIWESAIKDPPTPANATRIDLRQYGSSSLAFFSPRVQAAAPESLPETPAQTDC